MSGNIKQISVRPSWETALPELRFALGAAFFMTVITLWNYPLAYVAPVLALSFIGPGSKPLPAKAFFKFIVLNGIANFLMLIFSEALLDYPLVFYPCNYCSFFGCTIPIRFPLP